MEANIEGIMVRQRRTYKVCKNYLTFNLRRKTDEQDI